MILAASTLAVALTLVACGEKPAAMPTHAFVQKGVTLKLDPAAAPDCKSTTTFQATLNWTVDPSVTSKTEVRLDAPDGKVFARSNDQRAHADTGNWVRPGTWFLLFDRRNNELLGAVQAGPASCK